MKYNEEALLTELRDYIIGTYNQHYATDKIQTLDLIDACGDCLLYTSPSPRDLSTSRMPSSA